MKNVAIIVNVDTSEAIKEFVYDITIDDIAMPKYSKHMNKCFSRPSSVTIGQLKNINIEYY